MDTTATGIGGRVRASIPAGMTQGQLAEAVDMPPDALSRSLHGKRGFAPFELARIADELQADLHWFITGEPDPFSVRIAARHSWDSVSGAHTNPGASADEEIVSRIVGVYREAYPDGPPPTSELPSTAAATRERLGDSPVRELAERVQDRLDVDVVRVPGLTTDYSLCIGARRVILLGATHRWFRSNWSLAHELGHIVLGHHLDDGRDADRDEPAANRFASELLLPRKVVLPTLGEPSCGSVVERELANAVWDLGVSTEALYHRAQGLEVDVSESARHVLRSSTSRLMREHIDPSRVSAREMGAVVRSAPLHLITALEERTRAGEADPLVLNWLLDVPVDEIDFPDPDGPEMVRKRQAAAERRRQETLDLARQRARQRAMSA
ncbi:helix-turn-helix domain-containing protein [Brevibacterium litoralis]|uniref:helix-turn-helix domain-containing protein n=1 Tax=Brevibacterium litoralis TaxID=3138935 RepID=UPI0032EE883A